MGDLLDAILARCDDIERVAREAASWPPGARWRVSGERTVTGDTDLAGTPVAAYIAVTPDGPVALASAHAAHIALWHPEAALHIAAGIRELVGPHWPISGDRPWCVACCEGDPTLWPCTAVRTAARMLGMKAAP